MSRMLRLCTFALLLAFPFVSFAQENSSAKPADKKSDKKADKKKTAKAEASTKSGEAAPANATAAEQKKEDDPLLKALNWRLVGPYRGGRVLAVTGVAGDPLTFYFGGVGGGVWKTTDAGATWKPISDKERFSSVGAIAVAESDPNVIYVGTGEACIRGNIIAGNGVWKSTDAGKTWQHIGLEDTRHIGRLIIDPKNPDIAFVAALGHAYGPNAERGVYRTTDGGKTWQKVLYKDEKTGAIDLSFDPNNSRIIFASMYQAGRTPWGFNSGGPGSGLYRSADGGTTWKKVEGNGFPSGELGKIGVTVSGGDGNRVYALVEAEPAGGLYRSDDGGEHWRRTTDDRRFRQRAWYYTHVFADPKTTDTVYILNTSAYRSTDGGRTFQNIGTPHGDNHGFWIDPTNPKRMINGNDGGATVSLDGGATWSTQDNQPTAQFYHVIADNAFPYRIYGSQQDNSSVGILSRTKSFGIGRQDWYPVGGCESGYIAPDPRNPEVTYAGCYGNHISRYDHATDEEQEVTAWPINPIGHPAADEKYRFQWTAPIIISAHDPNVIYHGANVLFKSNDRGMSWSIISPDLTRNDKSKQGPAGGDITHDNTSAEYYDVIFTVAESPLQKDLIWVGTDDGLIQITQDGGKNWQNVTPKGLPDWSRMSLIEAGHFDAGTAYAAIDRHELDDFAPYIYKTTDFGKSWTRVNGDLPGDQPVRAVREDPKRKGMLYASTETGVFVSWDDGAHWRSIQKNLPQSSMRDLWIKDNDLLVATHGRSFWALDDITPLREYQPAIANDEAHLFAPSPAYRIFGGPGGRGPSGQNPPSGAIIYYWLKNAVKPPERKPEAAKEGQPDSAKAEAAAANQQPVANPAEATTPRAITATTKEEARPQRGGNQVVVEILDAAGKVIRRFPPRDQLAREGGAEEAGEGFFGPRPQANPTGDAGLNRFVWNLREEDATAVPGAVLWGGSTAGPVVPPGKYQVRLTVAGKSETQPLEVKGDPRLKTTTEDYQKQYELLSQIKAELDEVDRAINQMREVKKQVDDLSKRLGTDQKNRAIVDAGKKLTAKITPIEDALIQSKAKSGQDVLNYPVKLNNDLVALASTVGGSESAPTKQSYDAFEFIKQQADPQLQQWKQVLSTDVATFNDTVRQQQVPAIAPGDGKPQPGGPPAAGGGEDEGRQR